MVLSFCNVNVEVCSWGFWKLIKNVIWDYFKVILWWEGKCNIIDVKLMSWCGWFEWN